MTDGMIRLLAVLAIVAVAACQETPPRAEVVDCVLKAGGRIYDLRDVAGFVWYRRNSAEIFIGGTYDNVPLDTRDYEKIERAWIACRQGGSR